jgi:uncharacterized damage-inducible protein DinB
MAESTRTEKIEQYAQGYDKLASALKQYPERMWTFKPASDEWSIHEIVVHIADAEVNGYVRVRRLIAEPGGTIVGYDQEAWMQSLGYHQQSTHNALELIRLLRSMTAHVLRGLPDEVWSHTVTHTEAGTYTFDTWLDVYVNHVELHLDQLKQVYEAWKSRN